MTKIAHLDRKREQDSAVGERNDEKLTRVARATKAGTDVARESVELAQSATEALAQRTADAAEELYGRRASWQRTRPSLATPSRISSGADPPERGHPQRLRSGRELDGCRPGSEQAHRRQLLRFSQFNARYGQFLLRGMTATATSPRR